MVRSYSAGVAATRPDTVIVEEPMEIRLDDHLVATTMRTPGNDFELAAGYVHNEGLLGGARVHDIRYCATGSAVDTEFNVVTVGTRGDTPPPRPRLGPTTASCGICGSDSIATLTERLQPLAATAPPRGDTLLAVASTLHSGQPLFATTGSVHGAAAFDLESGEVAVAREDIGRHNATDKVVGRLLLDDRLPASHLGLFLSGRVSIELVQKAWAAGMPVVAAVGGPSSLAVATARAAGITLAAFVRGDRFNVYSGEVA
jgi:FdhD protein